MVTILRKSAEVHDLNSRVIGPNVEHEKQYTLQEVAEHCDISSCWIAVRNKVYDVTEFLSKHPGGVDVILENAGTDATVPFTEKGHSAVATEMMSKYFIGDLMEEDKRKL